MRPLVSVVVPAYNEQKRLPLCLDSLRRQTLSQTKFEIIVVDNLSTDNTVKIANKYHTRVVSENQKGVIFAKQRGFLSALGKYVAFLDADSIAPPDWLESLLAHLTRPGVVAATGPFVIIDGPTYHRRYVALVFKLVGFVYHFFGRILYVSGSNLAFRRSVAQKFGGLDTHKNMGEDEAGIKRKLLKHGQIIYDPAIVVRTSGRRASGGVANFLSQILFRYSLNYFTSQIFGRSIFPPFTDFR